MNLFLLTAVPLAAVVFHSLLHADRRPFADYRSWIWGSAWALVALLAASFFGRWREFTGDLISAFFGLAFTDALLVPGIVVAAWILSRPRGEAWELALWLTLTFTMAGIRDFASTSPASDLHNLFLVPLDRILVILGLPAFVVEARDARTPLSFGLWAAVASSLALTAALFAVLSYSNLGWLVWVLELGGIAALLVGERLAAFVRRAIAAARSTQP